MLKILHFADAHIDMANYGRRDPQSGLPMRVMDFLKSLDAIVETAISEKVDLVLFAGDAYKDRSPAPTFQREWGRRIMRLSRSGIRTFLLVGNHDLSPALGRANAIEEFMTLEVPNVYVLDRPAYLSAEQIGLPLQMIALPWVSRSGLMAHLGMSGMNSSLVYEELEARLTELVQGWLEQADPHMPTLLTAHASVQGARYGGERTVMLGSDLVLPRSLVCDPRLDYTALGHIHKPQNLNENAHPPVIYPGSIERVDFGEAAEDKFFIIAEIEKGKTQAEWRRLDGVRPFVDRFVCLDQPEQITERLIDALPEPGMLSGAIVRLTVEYPREWESLLDEGALREYLSEAFDFQLVKRPQADVRIRLPEDQSIGSLTPLELLEKYWESAHAAPEEIQTLLSLAEDVMHSIQERGG
jgi:DNA repair protein SbcD/Mre11